MRRRIGYAEYPLYRYSGCVVAQPDMLYDACITGEPYPLKAGWWQSTNPLACCSQAPESKAYRALMSLDFNVVVDLFMTPTAMACAEVVLPVATWAEKTGLRSIWYYMQPINAAVDSSAIDVRSDLQINLDLGKRWAPEKWPWDTVEEFFSDQMGSTGRTYEQLREANWMYPQFEYHKYRTGRQRPDGQPGFNTPTGRLEFKFDPVRAVGVRGGAQLPRDRPRPAFDAREDEGLPAHPHHRGAHVAVLPLRGAAGAPPARPASRSSRWRCTRRRPRASASSRATGCGWRTNTAGSR